MLVSSILALGMLAATGSRGGAASRPFYWASFTAIGRADVPIDIPADGRFAALASASFMLVAAPVAAAVMIALAVGVRRRRRRGSVAP